jgi:hypothetical protein
MTEQLVLLLLSSHLGATAFLAKKVLDVDRRLVTLETYLRTADDPSSSRPIGHGGDSRRESGGDTA